MKVKARRETVEKLIALLDSFDASTEQFLDDLPTPEKYSILGMALVVSTGYDDLEDAVYDSERNVPAQELTKHLLNFKFLSCHLQDALRIGFERFEYSWNDGETEAEDE